ncbi:MAG: hypothetical protein GY832_11225 [Chloroflexi bacterium]|nr:hypothetical protein [Chloroflexota bacterium]
MINLDTMTPEELCQTYRAELRRVYGDERAQKSRVDYHRSWYYINVARKYEDGSIGPYGIAPAFRKSKVIELIRNLRKRKAAP